MSSARATSLSVIASGRRRPATAALRQPLRGPHERLAPAVRQRQAERHAAVRARRLDERGQRPAHERRQARRGRRSSSAGCRAPPARRAPRARTGRSSRISSATSAAGRSQFCAENAYSVRCRMPSSRAARTVRRTASAPWRCPSARAPPRAAAQRPLPSMMIATWSGSGFKRPPPLQKTPAGRPRRPRSPRTVALRRRTVGRRRDRSRRGAHDGATAYGRPRMRKPPSPPEPSIIRSTLRALLHPRRLIPIVLLSASLVVAQGSYSARPVRDPAGHRDVRRVRHRRAGVVAGAVPRPRRLPPRRHPADPVRHDRGRRGLVARHRGARASSGWAARC